MENERIAVIDYESPPVFLEKLLENKANLVICSQKVFGKIAADIGYFKSLFNDDDVCTWITPETTMGSMIFSDDAKRSIAGGQKVIVCLSDDGSDWDDHIKIMSHLDYMKAKVAFLVKVK